jgi:hypothetical protein
MKNVWCLTFLMIASSTLFAEEKATHLSPAVQQGWDQGFRTCSKTLDELVRYVAPEQTGHYGVWNKHDADNRMFSTILIKNYTDGKLIAAANGTKNKAGSCDANGVQIWTVPGKSCGQLRETTFKEWKYYDELAGIPMYDEGDGNAGTALIMVPIEPYGCLVVKQVLMYN